ncbi:MAG: Got1/Sft2-like family vesicle transport protein [archaeon]|nr:Got1/Sft2-like family vesicle transport protein [archaeon]
MDIQGNIEINSGNKSKENYSNVKGEDPNSQNGENKNKGIVGKLQSVKKMVNVGGFFGKNNEENNETKVESVENSNDIKPIESKTWRDKLISKIVNSLEIERNIPVFLGLIGVGCGLIVLSIFLLPFIVVSPHKFCLCFAFGGLLITISFLFLKGTQSYFRSICAKDRFIITILYLVSIILGIGFALGKRYIFSVICAIYQCVALVLFILSFIPGGKKGIKCIKDFFTSPFTRLWANSISSQLEQ